MGSRSPRGVARSFVGGRDIDGAAIVVGAVAVVEIVVEMVVEKCANVTPAGTGGGAKFVFSNHLIGLEQDEAEIDKRAGRLATDAAGSDFVGESGERILQIDLRNTFAHEGLE